MQDAFYAAFAAKSKYIMTMHFDAGLIETLTLSVLGQYKSLVIRFGGGSS
jgi:hypothetical protein